MPWTETSVMEERLRFVARLLEGEPMSDVCREFGISRKTGYKLFERYREEGPVALADRSRRPVRYANQLPVQVEMLINLCAKCWAGGLGPRRHHSKPGEEGKGGTCYPVRPKWDGNWTPTHLHRDRPAGNSAHQLQNCGNRKNHRR